MTKRLLTGLALLLVTSLSAQDPALYRTIDGSQNNLANPEWGAAHTALLQLAGVGFTDGYSTPGGTDRPNPRYLSNIIFDQPDLLPEPMSLSDFTWVFGQFLDHDIGLTENNNEPLNILVPQGDPDFDPLGFGNVQIPMNRNAFMPGTGTDVENPRQYANEITAFIDGSAVYGSSQERADWLRTFQDGKLKTSTGNLLPYNTVDGEFDSPVDPAAPHMADDVGFSTRLFVAGDVRANENPLLCSFHTLFVREHNRQCDLIRAANPGMTDEEIYQYARKMVGGQIQAIVYNEWLPAMGIQLNDYQGYDPGVHPQLSNTFTAAAFRVGHTLLNSIMLRVDPAGNELPQGHLPLRFGFFNPAAIPEVGGIDPYLSGMAQQTQQTMDSRIVDDVRNFLFGPPGAGGLDLAAININRGRERGLPTFNAIREAYGLPAYFFLEQINADINIYSQLFEAYFGDINKVDPWIGMLAESRAQDALFGPTITAIMHTQFSALRDGDRFFYLNDPVLTQEDKDLIDQTTFRDVIMHNTGITLMQDNVFLAMPYADICGSATTTVSGNVLAHTTLDVMADVQVNYLLDGELQNNSITNAGGGFAFSNVPVCESGTLSPVLDGDSWLNGVSIQDIVIISRHILGLEEMSSPYQLLAADVNLDGQVRVTDIIAIRRLILDLEDSLPTDAPMWNFIPASYAFTDPSAPWTDEFPTSLTLPSPAMMLEGQDFIAYKRGDVNASAILTTGNFQQDEMLARHTDPLVLLSTEDRYLTAGETTTVFLRLEPLDERSEKVTYQFGLATNKAIMTAASPSPSTPNYLHLTERGNLRFCGEITAGQAQQFEVTLTPRRSGYLTQVLSLADDDDIPAFALGGEREDEAGSIALDLRSSQVTGLSNVGLEPVAYPNPFVDQISFTLPEQTTDGAAVLELFAPNGRLVLHQERQLAAGVQGNWTVTTNSLPAGVYTYRLRTANQTHSGQLIAQGR